MTPRGKRSPPTVNRYLAALSHACGVAVKEWGWLEENPLRKVSKLKESRGRTRFLLDDERAQLLKACQQSDNAYLYPIVVIALSTGMRKSEILNLKWQDIDLDKGAIILHETKNGERRRVPLQHIALENIKQHGKVRNLKCDYVFPSHKTCQPIDIRAPWEKALKDAQIENFRFHDLRHSAASYLAMNGASLAEVAEVLGHKTLQMVKRYAHLSEAHTSAVVSRMNERIFGDG
jgi:integrase